MNDIIKLCLIGGFTALLVGCSDAGTDQTAVADKTAKSEQADTKGATNVAENEFEEISWEDLMPEGEEELLESLYMEFYEEFERNMQQQSSTLMEATKDQMTSDDIVEGSADDTMEQIGTFNVVKDLNGQPIRIPGYVVPFDFSAEAKHKEFLLVPYFGACLHTPPPPPNQIIFVKSDPAAKILNIEEPVWLEGTLSTGEFMSELGNSAYELKLTNLEPYEY